MNRYDMIQEAKEKVIKGCPTLQKMSPAAQEIISRLTADGFLLLREVGRKEAGRFLMSLTFATYENEL